MCRRVLVPMVILALALGGWFGWRLWREIRGAGPALRPPAADIAELIEKGSTTTTTSVNLTEFPLRLPPGFSIGVFAKGLDRPRDLLWAEDGLTLLVTDMGRGQVLAYRAPEGSGESDPVVLASQLQRPHGLAFGECEPPTGAVPTVCDLYVAEEHRVSLYVLDLSQIEPRLTFKQKLFDLPTGGNHVSRSLLRLPDGRLLVSVGSTCNVCNESDWRRAKVLVWDGKELKEFARGLRNAVFLTLDERGGVWVTEMGRDLLGDDVPPDEINIVEEGKNYGWPTCYGKNIHDTDFDKNVYIRNPCQAPLEVPSHIDLQAHSAPLGLAFISSYSSWPEEWRGDLIVAYHGSWNRSVPTGYKLVRIKLDGQGRYEGIEDFITGWLTPDGKALGRPVDVEFGGYGTLFVSDDKAGVIYHVRYQP